MPAQRQREAGGPNRGPDTCVRFYQVFYFYLVHLSERLAFLPLRYVVDTGVVVLGGLELVQDGRSEGPRDRIDPEDLVDRTRAETHGMGTKGLEGKREVVCMGPGQKMRAAIEAEHLYTKTLLTDAGEHEKNKANPHFLFRESNRGGGGGGVLIC